MDDFFEFLMAIVFVMLVIFALVSVANGGINTYNEQFTKFNLDCIKEGGQIINLNDYWICQK